jgi:hypothetical protein
MAELAAPSVVGRSFPIIGRFIMGQTLLKRRLLVAAASLMAIALSSTSANAAIIVSPTLSVGDAYYVGLINDGIPSNPADEVSYINNLITLATGAGNTTIGSETYNRISSTNTQTFATAVTTNSAKDESENPSTILTGVFQYIIGKYDASQAGSLVWFNADGFSGTVTVPSTLNGKGVSHISVYNRGSPGGGVEEIPEPLSIVVWSVLGAAALGGVYIRRSRR